MIVGIFIQLPIVCSELAMGMGVGSWKRSWQVTKPIIMVTLRWKMLTSFKRQWKIVFPKKKRQNGGPLGLFVPQAMLAQSCKKTFTNLSNNQILRLLKGWINLLHLINFELNY
jgi:hypothetical protein